jgi:hypothetical protein
MSFFIGMPIRNHTNVWFALVRAHLVSVSLDSSGTWLYVQSVSTMLWCISINGTMPNITLTPVWACTYTSAGTWHWHSDTVCVHALDGTLSCVWDVLVSVRQSETRFLVTCCCRPVLCDAHQSSGQCECQCCTSWRARCSSN